MTNQPNRRVRKETMDDLMEATIALLQLTDYAPFDPSISKAEIASIVEQVKNTREQEKLAADAYNKTRDTTVSTEQKYYRMMLAARRHCVVQYGENSSIVRALGLKRRSDYKRRGRNNTQNEVETPA